MASFKRIPDVDSLAGGLAGWQATLTVCHPLDTQFKQLAYSSGWLTGWLAGGHSGGKRNEPDTHWLDGESELNKTVNRKPYHINRDPVCLWVYVCLLVWIALS